MTSEPTGAIGAEGPQSGEHDPKEAKIAGTDAELES
jgi:hypothetical protein